MKNWISGDSKWIDSHSFGRRYSAYRVVVDSATFLFDEFSSNCSILLMEPIRVFLGGAVSTYAPTEKPINYDRTRGFLHAQKAV